MKLYRLHHRKWLLLFLVLTIVAATVIGINVSAIAQQDSTSEPAVKPWFTPAPPPHEKRIQNKQRTEEEVIAMREETMKELKANGGYPISVRDTRAIDVADKVIQLPPNAYVSAFILSALCKGGAINCPRAPLWVITRGGSTITLEKISGKIVSEKIAPGEEGAFDFIREALRS